MMDIDKDILKTAAVFTLAGIALTVAVLGAAYLLDMLPALTQQAPTPPATAP